MPSTHDLEKDRDEEETGEGGCSRGLRRGWGKKKKKEEEGNEGEWDGKVFLHTKHTQPKVITTTAFPPTLTLVVGSSSIVK